MHENTILVKTPPRFLFHTTGTCANHGLEPKRWLEPCQLLEITASVATIQAAPAKASACKWHGIHAVFKTLAVEAFTWWFLHPRYPTRVLTFSGVT